MVMEYTDPVTGLPIEDEEGIKKPVQVDYSGNRNTARSPFFDPLGKPFVEPWTPGPAPEVAPLSFTPPAPVAPPPGSLNEYNQNQNNWYVAKGVAKIAKPDGTMVANPFDLTPEEVYFALAGDAEAVRRLHESLNARGKGDMFHNIVNYYEPGGQGFASGDYTPADAARAQYNFRQGMRTGGMDYGQEVTQGLSEEAIAFQLSNGSIVKGPNGKYYYPKDPYYAEGGGGFGTNEGDVYNGLKTYDQGIQDFGTNKSSKYTNPPPGGGTTPPPTTTYNPLDAENPWFSKMKVETPGITPSPATTTPPPVTSGAAAKAVVQPPPAGTEPLPPKVKSNVSTVRTRGPVTPTPKMLVSNS